LDHGFTAVVKKVLATEVNAAKVVNAAVAPTVAAPVPKTGVPPCSDVGPIDWDLALNNAPSDVSGKRLIQSGFMKGTQNFVVCQDVVEVKAHRRIPVHRRAGYVGAVVAEIKNRFGLPKDTEANRVAVRRMAKNIMEKHGVRPTHIRSVIEVVIAGVFVPDEHDIQGAAIMKSNLRSQYVREMNSAGGKSEWSHLWNKLCPWSSDKETTGDV